MKKRNIKTKSKAKSRKQVIKKINLTQTNVRLLVVVAFFTGVLVTEYIKNNFTSRQMIEWQHVVILIEIFLLFLVGFLPKQLPNALVNVTVSFVCSLQANSFRKTNGLPYVTTMCTGNLRSAAVNFFSFLTSTDKVAGRKSARYILIIFSFCSGAALGVIFTGIFNEMAVWTCCLLLLAVFTTMIYGK
jgi:uncharacterized membrane protein YoaK (UPF0700 family)